MRLAAIVEDSDDAIFVTSLDGRIQTWNRAAQRLFGYSADEAINKKITTLLIPPSHKHEERDFLRRVRNGKRVSNTSTGVLRQLPWTWFCALCPSPSSRPPQPLASKW